MTQDTSSSVIRVEVKTEPSAWWGAQPNAEISDDDSVSDIPARMNPSPAVNQEDAGSNIARDSEEAADTTPPVASAQIEKSRKRRAALASSDGAPNPKRRNLARRVGRRCTDNPNDLSEAASRKRKRHVQPPPAASAQEEASTSDAETSLDQNRASSPGPVRSRRRSPARQESEPASDRPVERSSGGTNGAGTTQESHPNSSAEAVTSAKALPGLSDPQGNPLRGFFDSFDGRRYDQYKDAQGQIRSASGALIPSGYRFHPSEISPFICPVRDCRTMFDSMVGLGRHFDRTHRMGGFNDNCDGTLSFKYQYSSNHTMKYVDFVVSRDPIPADARPAREPKVARSVRSRMLKLGMAARRKPGPKTPVHAPGRASRAGLPKSGALAIATPSPAWDTISYLERLLNDQQVIPERRDVQWMANLPRKRSLPRAWLDHHEGSCIDDKVYACALAYLVGNEVKGQLKCRARYPTSDRLSGLCIQPPSMPPAAASRFTQVPVCVGCAYRAHMSRQGVRCDWKYASADIVAELEALAMNARKESLNGRPKPRAEARAPRDGSNASFELWAGGTGEEAGGSDDDFEPSSPLATLNEPMSPGGETLSGMGDNSETINAPRVVMEATGPRDNTSTGPPDDNNAREDTLLAENEAMSPTNDTTMETGDDVDMRPVQNEATSPMIKTSDSPGQIIVIDDDDSDMTELEEVEEEEDVEEEEEEEEEDEQHARMADQRDVNPNPVRDGSGRKGDAAVTLSARYLTSHAAITISDGIGVHRTYIQPGEGHVWSAATNKLRYCEVISGKLDVKSEGKVVSIGRGGLFVIHPKMAVSAENPGSAVVELSCHTHTTCLAVPDRSRR